MNRPIEFDPVQAILSFMPVPEGQLERVIKNRSSAKNYAAGGVWTANPTEARIFEDLSLALEAAQNDGLKSCSIIVFRSGSREIDAQFPID